MALPSFVARAVHIMGGLTVPLMLLSLGYSEREATIAAKQLPPDASVSDGIKQALKLLARN